MFKEKYALKHLIGWTLASVAVMFFAFYSFLPLSENQLNKADVTINVIEKYTEHRVSWVNLYDNENNKYYCHEEILTNYNSASVFADVLEEEYKDKELTIYYTDRIDLTPINIPRFWGFNRVAAIKCGSETIVNLDAYNSANTEALIGWLIVAVVILLFATGPFIIVRIMEISAKRKNKYQHP